jgi:hypothetical protein
MNLAYFDQNSRTRRKRWVVDAETTSRGAGTGPAARRVPRVAGPEAAVEDPETGSRNAQAARI